MDSKKNVLRTFGKLAAELFILIIAGYFLLVAVYALPMGRMQAHVGSLETFNIMGAERNYPKLIAGHEDTRLDNFTDAIMLRMASSESEYGPFKNALLNPRGTSNGGEASAEDVMCMYLGEPDYHTYFYSRYWHGYLLWLKPLCMFLSYDEIRYFLTTVDLLVFGLALYLMGKKDKKELALPFSLAMLSLNIPAVCLSMQYNSCYLLTVLSVIAILYFDKWFEDKSKWPFFFLLTGAMTSYFDFLTYPVIVFAIPMAMVLSIYGDTLIDDIKLLFINGISWSVGYLLLWASKWIMAQLFTGEPVIKNALDEILFRTSNEGHEGVATIRSVLEAEWYTQHYYIELAIIFAVVGLIVGLALKKRRLNVAQLLIMILINVIPVAWYVLTKNHSIMHTYMTYRLTAVNVFAIAMMGVSFKKSE